MKKTLFILLAIVIISACNNTGTNQKTTEAVTQDSVAILNVDEFLANQSEYVNRDVVITGMVAHICKHGGQKLFLLGTDPEKYLRVNTGEKIAEFPITLEGSTVEVTGIVNEFEIEAAEPDSATAEGGHEKDSTGLEGAYHKDNFYVIVAESYVVKE